MRLRSVWFVLLMPLLTACDGDDTLNWEAQPDTVLLYSASRAEYIGRNSAFDFVFRSAKAIEDQGSTNNWDFTLAEQNGQLVLAPASAFSGLSSRAGLADIGPGVLEEIRRAPSDTAAFKSTPTVVRMGTIYVVRTRRATCPGGFGTGVIYAKMEALNIDLAAGTLRFRAITNPFCNDRALIPPED
jgi:hypothetical protein